MDIFNLSFLWLVLKAFFVLGLLVYLIFAIVVVRQVRIMNDTLDVGFGRVLILISFLHLAFAVGILGFALISL